MLNNYFKIILSILSTLNIYYITNHTDRTIHNNNNIINFFIHSSGQVCPFGVFCGKIIILLSLIQIYYLYTNNYQKIKKYNIICLILGVIFSFMNSFVQINIIPAFIMQLLIIFC